MISSHFRVALCLVFSSCLIVIGLFAAPVQAGDYLVRQCLGSGHQGFFGDFYFLGNNDRIDVVQGCGPNQAGKTGIYQDRSGAPAPYGSGGQFFWSPPATVGVYGTSITSKLKDADGFEASLFGASNSWPRAELDGSFSHDGQPRTSIWTNRAQPQDLIVARLICNRTASCPNVTGGPKAFFEISDLEFRSVDRAVPSVGVSGPLWEWGTGQDWHRGQADFRITAQDSGSGVAATYLTVNGLRLDQPTVDCPGVRPGFAVNFTPCPPKVDQSGAVDTAAPPFREGENRVQFCSQDYATDPAGANRSCASTRSIFVDSTAPTQPVQLHTVGGDGWRSKNDFEIAWRNPATQGSAISTADFRVTRKDDGSLIRTGSVAVGDEPVIRALRVPGSGEYLAEVRLRDEAGNTGPPGFTTLRLDDVRPGDVAPEPSDGWVSADEFPLEQSIERAQTGGPSGIEGYAVEISRSGPVSPCGTGVCSAGNLTLVEGPDRRTMTIKDLEEGSTWISAVASSGARLASANTGSAVIRVDKSVPEVEISGVPRGWVNEPVTLTAKATDTESGMDPQPATDDGKPVTVIRAGDLPPHAEPGDTATLTVTEEGETSVAFWARDLAGNTNDGALLPAGGFHPRPGETTVKIDRRRPMISIDEQTDRSDPEIVTATVRDSGSGLESGIISIRRQVVGSEALELETTLEDGHLRARILSDRLPAGSYELLAQVLDRAGNIGRTDSSGLNRTVRLPLKERAELDLGFLATKATRTKLGHGKWTNVSGRLSSGGRAVTGARVVLEQEFSAGAKSRVSNSESRTDGDGRFVFRLRPGPSRSVRVRYAGSRVTGPATSRDLKVIARDRITFEVKPAVVRNGGTASMVGTVNGRGALKPARGKLVAIQYYDPSRRRWRPVEVLRASRSGRFEYRYRFRTISYAQRIIFRAVSLPEAGWPFKPSSSARRSVIVYPKT